MPIYVTLFWSIALAGNEKKHSTPRRFLGKFMLFPLVIFISHFIYFSAEKEIYPYFDVVLQFASLMVFPFYYIYFRLLTVDEKFSLKSHVQFLIIPAIITAIYGTGVLLTPKTEFNTWLFDQNAYPDSAYIQFLNVMRTIIRITYLLQVIVSVTGNYLLIRKYGAKAEQFYSDLEDGKYNNARLLNLSIIIMSVASFCFTALGRDYLMSQDTMIYSGWCVFSIMLFIIGYMGIKQKPINPTFELETLTYDEKLLEEIPIATQKKILDKMLAQFDEKKIYLNSQLTIMDVAQLVGTNRSYISGLINRQYNQNFCSFVNNYRLEELKEIIHNSPDSTNDILAENCGFGSVISLKRAIQATAGISITEWKYNELTNGKARLGKE